MKLASWFLFAGGLLATGEGATAGPAVPVLDPEPGERQKPYSPADNQVVEVTPPPFIWVPAGRDATYVLQISRSKEFPSAETRTFSDLKRSVFVPRETLPAGAWFWRYGVQMEQGIVYGRPRPFTVPPNARPFPFPDIAEIVRRVPRERPRVIFPKPFLDQIRHAAQGELKPRVEAMVQSCRRMVGEELVPEPGYPPEDRTQMGPWAVQVMRTTRPPMDRMETCALVYLLTGDREIGLEAKRRLLHFFSWNPEGATSFFTYDEPPMWMMMRGTRAYDWTYDLFTPEERARIEANMKVRAQQFLRRLQSLPFESNPYDSHAGRLPGFLGECALSFIHEWPEARQWLEYVTLLYYTSYPAWGGDDGGWQEGPGYWSAYMSFVLHFVVALKRATGVDLMQKPFLRNTGYYGLYTATPYHEHSPFGDGQTGPPRCGSVMYAFSSLTGNPYYRWYAEAAGYRPGGDLLSLATYDPSLKARSPLELPQARVFPAVGLVSMHTALGDRENDISFLMRSSPYGSTSHGHADQNAFVIEAFGKGLAIATGYYPWYGSPHHHEWTRATRAVNSILVNGEGQVRRSYQARGEITAFRQVTGYDYAEGEATPAYGGALKRFRRHVVHVRPGIFILFDDLVAQKPSTFQWLLHAYDRIAINEQERLLHVERTPAAMNVHFLLPTELAFSQTDRYDPEPEQGQWQNTWHLTASTVRAEEKGHFLTVLMPYRVGQEPALPKVELLQGQGAVGVRLIFPDGAEDQVAFRTDALAKEVQCGDLKGTGRVLARGRRKEGTLWRELSVE